MPKRILIIGMIYSFFGLLASWNIVSGLLQSRIYPDITVLLLPIGLDLIKGKLWAQWWARFCIILGYIVCAFFIGIAVASPENSHFTYISPKFGDASFNKSVIGVEASIYLIIITVVFAIILGLMHKLLYSEKAEDYFLFYEATQKASTIRSLSGN